MTCSFSLSFLLSRKDYYLAEEFEGKQCSFPLENNLQSVEHLRISSKELLTHSNNYFANVTQLTIANAPNTLDESFLIPLNRLIPLKQLTHLTIEYNWLAVENIVRLIHSAPNLHTLKMDSYISEKELQSLEQSTVFQDVLTKNRVRYIYCSDLCLLTEIKVLMKLFPRMEYLDVSISRKEINQIITHLFRKNFRSLHRLVSLCLTEVPKVCLQEVDQLLKWENLLENYCLKHLNGDLYIWW